MSFRVKDFYKNILAEFDTYDEMESYISSSQVTSSIELGEDCGISYFQFDDNIHEILETSGSLYTSGSKEVVRITYLPGEDDVE